MGKSSSYFFVYTNQKGGNIVDNILKIDSHYVGTFNIEGKQYQGEIVHNIQNGTILLSIKFKIDSFEKIRERNFPNPDIIVGTLTTGIVVNLYNNKLVKNYTHNLEYHEIQYLVESMVWTYNDLSSHRFDKMVCELDNGLEWSNLSRIEPTGFNNILIHDSDSITFFWYNAKIEFSTTIKNELARLPRDEICEVSERLVVAIKSDEKQDNKYFTDIRDKLLSMISFAIQDNINIHKQYFIDLDVFHNTIGYIDYCKYRFFDNIPIYNIHKTSWLDYIFCLNNLSQNDPQLPEKLEKLSPVFNLSISLFKYQSMPREMVFLNIVQALETLHSRFFYQNDKKKYIQSVKERFSEESLQYKLLLSNTQMDTNCSYIILASRLNDLLIRGRNNLFVKYYRDDSEFAQRIADTRHYYTHYSESKKNKALKGKALIDSIYILKLLLEYNVCETLNIDISQNVAEKLHLYCSDECNE